MGLRCLLGHDFDEPGIEREREEDGDEVVTTVREVKTCARCGETQVVSENTEVTTIQQLTMAATDDDATAAEGSEPSAATEELEPAAASGGSAEREGTEPRATASVDSADRDPADRDPADIDSDPEAGGAEIIDADPNGTSTSEGPSTADDPAVSDEQVTDEHPTTADDPVTVNDPVTVDDAGATDDTGATDDDADATTAEADDGVILHDGDAPADAVDRERGAWPEVDSDEGTATEPQPWPEQRGEDEGFSAEIDEGDDSAGGVEFGGGLTPETTADPETDGDGETEFIEAPAPDAIADEERFATDAADREGAGGEPGGTGITRADGPEYEVLTDDTESEYYCPECGMTRGADGNSMRAGDICPECKRGYVDERPV